MNYSGSYRRLLGNARSAMVAAIEIYNKPRFDYRDEVFVILLFNAWELLLKTVLSKARRSIFYQKRRNQPYRTLSWSDAMDAAATTPLWPASVSPRAIKANLGMLSVFRDNAVHFYNATGFGVLVYSLAQTSIVNFRDMLREVFGQELGEEINWALLPLGVSPPVDPMAYLRGGRPAGAGHLAVDQFLKTLLDTTRELEDPGVDTGGLLTIFNVSLQSVKKIEQADIVVGIDAAGSADPVIVTRRLDPNLSHPYRRKDVLAKLGEHGVTVSTHTFDAVVWYYGLRENPTYWWRDNTVNLVKWSPETVTYLRQLTTMQLDQARAAYRSRSRPTTGVAA